MGSAVFPALEIVAACQAYLVYQQKQVDRRRQRWINTRAGRRDWPWRPWMRVGGLRAAQEWNQMPSGANRSLRRLDDRIDPIYALMVLARSQGPHGVVTVTANEFIRIQPFYVPTND